jgi:hypothetical protein
VREAVQVELRTLDGKVGYATGRDAVLQCVMVNDTTNLRRLIAEGQDIKAPLAGETTRGWTFLHLAALQGHAEVAELLIQSGADLNAKSNDGFTPLKIARDNRRSGVVAILQKYGAK